MNNKRRIIGITLSLALAIAGTVAIVAYVRSTTDRAIKEEALVDVYVVDALVPKGADATSIRSAVKVEQIPARLEQEGTITDLDALGDLVAAGDLQPGDQLVDARLTERDVVAEQVEDKVQISTLLEAHRAVGGALRPGDLVGVYISFEPFEVAEAPFPEPGVDPRSALLAELRELRAEADAAGDGEDAASGTESMNTPNVSRLEFQHVLVTDVQTINPPVARSEEDGDAAEADVEQVSGAVYVVTLALSPEESERFVFANEYGTLWLSLDPASVEDDGTRRVELGNVFEVVR